MYTFANDVDITVAKNCPVKKNGKTIGRVVGVHMMDNSLIIDFDLGDQDLLGMYSISIGEMKGENKCSSKEKT